MFRTDYTVAEIFEDGFRYSLFMTDDKFEAEVWLENHRECTNALRIGKSHLVLEDNRAICKEN